MSEVIDQLHRARSSIDSVIAELEKSPEQAALVDLIRACEHLDYYYQEMCAEHDEMDGESPGTTYEHGVSIEFYIEAMWWHDVSVALRALRKAKQEPR